MSDSTPEVSILIVTFNGRDRVRTCLSSLLSWTQDIPFEIRVFDNASTDGTPDMIAATFPSVQVERSSVNTGFAAGANGALRGARGRMLFVLNPDTEVHANVLPAMVRYLDEHPDVGLLGPKLVDPEGTLQLSCRSFPTFGTGIFNRYSIPTRLLPKNPFSRRYLMTDSDHSTTAPVDWLSGAAWLLPRRTIEKVGLLDEGYFWSIEDVDYCQRVHRVGLRVVYFPEVSVVHQIGGSSTSAPFRAIIARHRGMWRYYRKYLAPANPIKRVGVGAAVASGIGLRCSAQLLGTALRRGR